MNKKEFMSEDLSVMQVPVWSVKTVEPFKTLFPIRESVLMEMLADITLNGFDIGHPIIVWNMTVVDGHTRLKAAIAAGLETIPVVCHQFIDEEDALEYAIRNQRNRRNLTDGELLQCLQQLDMKKKRGRPVGACRKKKGKSSELTADILGVSRGKIEKLRAINEYASDTIKEALRQGKFTTNRAYEETMRVRRPIETNEPDADAELIHSIMANIHARMNTVQIRKLVKALQIELATN